MIQTTEAFAQELQRVTKYARYDYDLGRRETWEETVSRYMNYVRNLLQRHGKKLPERELNLLHRMIEDRQVMPSMRALAQAGVSAERNGIEIYNCSYMPVLDTYSLVEALMISMSGSGVGFSVESEYVNQWPVVPEKIVDRPDLVYKVSDSTIGWAIALDVVLDEWFHKGRDIRFDTSEIRPAGAPLRTKGGRASGPGPFERMIHNLRSIVMSRLGRKLTTVDVFDMMCLVGDCAVSGGKRRTAMIALFDRLDHGMTHAKDHGWWVDHPWRANANISMVVENASDVGRSFFDDYINHITSTGTGEPGLFFRGNAVFDRRGHREVDAYGTNPCGEIILKPWQFCNLTSIVPQPDDSIHFLKEKAWAATLLGLIQSLETNFPMLRSQWKENAEKERILGVDLTNQMSVPFVRQPHVLRAIRKACWETAELYSEMLEINLPSAICCVKPSGNSAMMLGTSSGIHAWWSEHFIRRFTLQDSDPVTMVIRDAGAPLVESPYNREGAPKAWLLEVPMAAPPEAITVGAQTAIDRLEYWLTVKTNYAREQNPSCTITYRKEEAEQIAEWLNANKDALGGLTFLLQDDHVLPLPPYEAIDRLEYVRRASSFPHIDLSLVSLLEKEDNTETSKELACSANGCEVP